MSFKKAIKAIVCAGFGLALAGPALAQDQTAEPSLRLELNSATDTTAGSCRLTYVATNQSDIALSRTAYEVAIFDNDGAVTRLLVLEFGQLPGGKTKVLQFDLADTQCATISRIVVNDVSGCTQASDGAEIDFCLSGLSATSRTAIQFGL